MSASFFDDDNMKRIEDFDSDGNDAVSGESNVKSSSDDEETVRPASKKSKKGNSAAPVASSAPTAAAAASAPKPKAVSTHSTPPRAQGQASKPFDWRVTIATPQTFKTSVTIMCRILSQCSFQLIKTSSFTGLRVDSMDSSMVCMIKASYECEIESNVEMKQEMFCVDTKQLNTLLKDVQPGHILTLTRFAEEDDLTLDSYARDDCSNRFTCTLSILDDDPKVPRMQPITYDFMVEMDLARLKSYCKMAQELNSSHMEFKILEPPASSSAQRHFYFLVGATGDSGNSFKRIFHSAVASEPDEHERQPEEHGRAHVTIRAVSTADFGAAARESPSAPVDFAAVQHTFDAKYCEVFSTNYLNTVLKSMDRQTVQLFMSEKLPLVIKYGLGNDFSHVQVILAPRLRDE